MWWSTSDIGWVVGHSYIVYAPLMAGATTIAYEGGARPSRTPTRRGRSSSANGVTGVFTSPTAVRLLMRYGEEVPRRHDLGRLERVFCAGEVLNAPAWEWLQHTVFEDRVPVIDHMWQTETGGPIFGNPYGYAAPAHQARLGRHPAARDRGGRRRPGRQAGRARGRRASCGSSGRSPA